jgi:hypothetical protein
MMIRLKWSHTQTLINRKFQVKYSLREQFIWKSIEIIKYYWSTVTNVARLTPPKPLWAFLGGLWNRLHERLGSEPCQTGVLRSASTLEPLKSRSQDVRIKASGLEGGE